MPSSSCGVSETKHCLVPNRRSVLPLWEKAGWLGVLTAPQGVGWRVLKSRMLVLFPPHVCSDQQAAELSAFVVTWTTDRITSEEVYWQPCTLTQK